MVALLPTHIQNHIIDKLKHGDFVGAKTIYDQWHRSQNQSPWEINKNDGQDNVFLKYPA